MEPEGYDCHEEERRGFSKARSSKAEADARDCELLFSKISNLTTEENQAVQCVRSRTREYSQGLELRMRADEFTLSLPCNRSVQSSLGVSKS